MIGWEDVRMGICEDGKWEEAKMRGWKDRMG
jgi:hypothetical protein